MLPILGWNWFFCNFLFLDRNFEKDKSSFAPTIDDYTDNDHPTQVVLFCEGTRFTKDKQKRSIQYAKDIGVKPLKHHLFPRARGFVEIVKHLKKSGKSK